MNKIFENHYVIIIIATILLALIPAFNVSLYIISILTLAALYAIFATSWDLVSGYTGNLVLGQALFIGVGGYSVALFQDAVGLAFALVIGVFLSVLAALFVGYSSTKVSGPFFSVITLVIPLILFQLAYTFTDITGGEFGLPVDHPFSQIQLFYITLALMLVCVLTLIFITKSRIGRVFIAIREDEAGSAALGNNVSFYKMLAIVISAIMSGLGGGFMVMHLQHVTPEVLDLWVSVNILIMGIIGGMGTIIGPFFAALFLTALTEWLRGTGEYQDLILSVILILAVLLMPKGVIDALGKLKRMVVKPKGKPKSEEKELES